MRFDLEAKVLRGEHGELPVPSSDEVTRKLAMLIEGECEGAGPTKAAKNGDLGPVARLDRAARGAAAGDAIGP